MMIGSLILGRKGSQGLPGKNLLQIRGKPIAAYPMEAVLSVECIACHYISTDDEDLKQLAKTYGFGVIDRPSELSTSEALAEDAYLHGYREICAREGASPEIMVLLFCNAPTFTVDHVREGISILQNEPDTDAAVTVSKYNMYSPMRARMINEAGYLDPAIAFADQPNGSDINCDRDSQGDIWFADVALAVVRASNLEKLEAGLLPQRWMGKKIRPLYNEAGLDIDFGWQLGQLDWWISKYKQD